MKISIEANIGAGKTTILNRLRDETNIPIFLESVDSWKMIKPFYSDKSRWGFAFNLEVLYSMSKYKDYTFPSVYERSPKSNHDVFARLLVDDNSMTQDEFDLYHKMYDEFSWSQEVMIYIHTSPIVCYERMKNRDRECERHVSIDYVQRIHDKHEEMIHNIVNSNPRTIIHQVDGNCDKETIYQNVASIVRLYVNN